MYSLTYLVDVDPRNNNKAKGICMFMFVKVSEDKFLAYVE
jgi:hypothetical protein